MYQSPIEILTSDFELFVENEVYKAVQGVNVNVDKGELLRALQYDREQYEKGYADGIADARGELVRCKDCKHYDNSEGIQWCHLNSKFGKFAMDWHSFPEDGFCSYGERRDNEES